VEDCFAEAKGEIGLDQYEVRRSQAWYHYVTLRLLAHAFLVIKHLGANGEKAGGKKGISGLT
jgi:SRSO17 transposase